MERKELYDVAKFSRSDISTHGKNLGGSSVDGKRVMEECRHSDGVM